MLTQEEILELTYLNQLIDNGVATEKDRNKRAYLIKKANNGRRY